MMKKLSIVLSLLLLLTAGAFCQTVTGNITASGSTCNTGGACVSVNIPQGQGSYAGGAVIGVSGTWAATLAFEATADGVNWVAINATSLSAISPVTSTTTNDSFQLNIAGAKGVRVRCSAFTSGTAVVTIVASPASARSGGSGGGGGGGATFSPNAIQYATSTSTARGATSTDVIGLFSGCSGSLVLAASGNCIASGSGTVTNTLGPLPPLSIVIGNGGNDVQVDGVATLDTNGNEIVTSSSTTGDGVHPGFISFSPNTTDNTLPVSTFSISGPLVASMTAWALRFPGTVPASGLCFKTGTATAGGIVPVTFASCGGGGGTSTINLPIAVAQGAGGCSLGGSAPVGNLPACLLVAGTGTTTQRGNMQFCQSGPCTYTGVGGGTSTPYMDYNITMPSSGITSVTFGFRADSDTNAAHNAVWDFQYVCSAPSAVATGTLAAAQTATGALDGTTSHFLSAILSAPTITGCAAGNLLQIRISLDASSTTTGNMNLISLQVIPQ